MVSGTREKNKREKNPGRKLGDYKVTNSREDVVSDTKYSQKVKDNEELNSFQLID